MPLDIQSTPPAAVNATASLTKTSRTPDEKGQTPEELKRRETFHEFVGQTFFSQMLGAMRKTVDKPAYFHGGRAEEIFQGQLDQILSEKLTEATAETFSEPMYELMMLPRR